MPDLDLIDRRLDALARERFRAKFHLRGRERAMVEEKASGRSAGIRRT